MSKIYKAKQSKEDIQEGIISIVLNTVLFILKIVAGILSGSVALVADAWHSLSDSFSSVVVIISSKISKKPADNKHPYGHGRVKIISAMFIGVLLGIAAFEFTIKSISMLAEGESANYGVLALVSVIVSIIIKEALARYALIIWKRTKSLMMKAEAWHHRSDALSSIAVLIGISLNNTLWWMDGVVGLIVSAMLFFTSIKIVVDSINPLLGEAPEEELINSIRRICDESKVKGEDCHHFHIHKYGSHVELIFHIALPGDMILDEAHEIISVLENNIKQQLGYEVTIHSDPGEIRD